MTNSKNSFLIGLCLALTVWFGAKAQPFPELVKRCASSDRDSIVFSRYPALQNGRNSGERMIRQYLRETPASVLRVGSLEEITIPVIVHVVHQSANPAPGGGQDDTNISDAQVESQIAILNEDYANRSGINTFYSPTLGVDTKIRFKLVGINRVFSQVKEFNPLSDVDKLASIAPARSTDQFLNIWVCKLGGRYLGSAQFPVVSEINSRTLGLDIADANDNPETDGVIIDYRYFGRNAAPVTSALYNLGRTTTHEVGHWLGLIHIWGDSYCGDDYCADTPTASGSNQVTDLNCKPVFSNCTGAASRNMTDNYMDYSPDLCMGLFTADQTERIHAVLNLSPRRARLVASARRTDDRLTVEIVSGPASDLFRADIYTPGYVDYRMDLYTNSGAMIISDIKNKSSFDVKNFPAGVYILRVRTEAESVTKRFLIL